MNHWAAVGLVIAFGLASPLQPGSKAESLFRHYGHSVRSGVQRELGGAIKPDSLEARGRIARCLGTTSDSAERALALWKTYSTRFSR